MNEENHEMYVEKVYESGNEIWQCLTCLRRFMISWNPFKKTVLDVGDENASHSGSKFWIEFNKTSIDKKEQD